MIDSHVHAYRHPVPFVTAFPTPEQVIERYDEVGIEKGILMPVVNTEIYLPQANEDIIEMVRQYPGRFIPFCNIDPRALTNSVDAPLDRLLKHYRDQGCKGVGEVMPNLPMEHPKVQNLFRHAQNAGLPLTFDGSDRLDGDFGLYDEPGLPQLERTLQRFPRLILIAHGLTFWAEISILRTPVKKPVFRPDGEYCQVEINPGPIKEEGVVQRLLRNYPNLYAELSDAGIALTRDHDYGPGFLAEFQDRLLFGTDYCNVGMPFPALDILNDWHSAGKITDCVYQKIARDNVAKLLGLG